MATILTNGQLTALKAAIDNDGALAAQPNNSDGNTTIAQAFNLAASPAWTLWRKSVPLSEIAVNLNGSELAGLTTGNHTRLQTIITLISAAGGANPSDADIRAFFDDVFSGAGGTTTRASLLVLWKELATRAEKLFSTGTGSDAVPATTDSNIPNNFVLNLGDVEAARNLP